MKKLRSEMNEEGKKVTVVFRLNYFRVSHFKMQICVLIMHNIIRIVAQKWRIYTYSATSFRTLCTLLFFRICPQFLPLFLLFRWVLFAPVNSKISRRIYVEKNLRENRTKVNVGTIVGVTLGIDMYSYYESWEFSLVTTLKFYYFSSDCILIFV